MTKDELERKNKLLRFRMMAYTESMRILRKEWEECRDELVSISTETVTAGLVSTIPTYSPM